MGNELAELLEVLFADQEDDDEQISVLVRPFTVEGRFSCCNYSYGAWSAG